MKDLEKFQKKHYNKCFSNAKKISSKAVEKLTTSYYEAIINISGRKVHIKVEVK